MKSFSFPKALTLGCLLVLAVPVACGDDESNPKPTPSDAGAGGEVSGTGGIPSTDGGAGGAAPVVQLPPGISDTSKTEMCTDEPKCASAAVGPVFIDPCCAGDACGLSTGFLGLVGAKFDTECQPKGQVGEVDASCPTSAASAVPFNGVMLPIDGFVGCCRENGKCGVVVDAVVSPVAGPVASLGLGCVDSAPFFPGKTIDSCGAGGGGNGGAGGVSGGGAPGTDGGAPVGGSGDAGGAGGAGTVQ